MFGMGCMVFYVSQQRFVHVEGCRNVNAALNSGLNIIIDVFKYVTMIR